MADNHSKEVRSMNMSHIRSRDTKPEEIVRKYLFSKGLRYRKNVKSLPGTPDIVLKKYKTAGSFVLHVLPSDSVTFVLSLPNIR